MRKSEFSERGRRVYESCINGGASEEDAVQAATAVTEAETPVSAPAPVSEAQLDAMIARAFATGDRGGPAPATRAVVTEADLDKAIAVAFGRSTSGA